MTDRVVSRRTFITALGLGAASLAAAPAVEASVAPKRRLNRVGLQLYTLRDDAKRDLERTLADIAAAGYKDVELLGSMNNFGMPAKRLRTVLDRVGLRAPSTHVDGSVVDNLDRFLDEAQILGHEQLVIASLPLSKTPTLDEYRKWADRLNEAGRKTRPRKVWMAFHDEAWDFKRIDGAIPYDVLAERTDPSVVRLQLDTGNLAMAGLEPLDYLRRYGPRYWSFHIKDVPKLGADHDVELGKGVIDFRRLLANIEHIDRKHLFVEQESYPGAPLDSVRRDYTYISTLRF